MAFLHRHRWVTPYLLLLPGMAWLESRLPFWPAGWLVVVTFVAPFEVNDVGVLTDGERVLGIGYGADVPLFMK